MSSTRFRSSILFFSADLHCRLDHPSVARTSPTTIWIGPSNPKYSADRDASLRSWGNEVGVSSGRLAQKETEPHDDEQTAVPGIPSSPLRVARRAVPLNSAFARALVGLVLFLSSVGCRDPRPEPFTLVVLPDTQCYCDTRLRQSAQKWGRDLREYFYAQTNWIRSAKEKLNIRFVVHEGDITQTDDPEEWAIARNAMATLDGHVPYCLCLGNHDMGYRKTEESPSSYDTAIDRSTRFEDFFPRSSFANQRSFGGSYDETLDNSYWFFEEGELEFMVVSLEFKPRDEVLGWANRIVREHPGRRTIVLTHSYLNANNERITSDGYRVTGNPGEAMWQKFVSLHANIFLVLCGHVLGEGRLTSEGIHGNPVHQLLADYQGWNDGGESWLRYMTFIPEENQIQVYTYNPVHDSEQLEPSSRFSLPYSMLKSGESNATSLCGKSPQTRISSTTRAPSTPVSPVSRP